MQAVYSETPVPYTCRGLWYDARIAIPKIEVSIDQAAVTVETGMGGRHRATLRAKIRQGVC